VAELAADDGGEYLKADRQVSTLALTSARSVTGPAYWAASSAVIGVLASR
jgi:hypothetical protein